MIPSCSARSSSGIGTSERGGQEEEELREQGGEDKGRSGSFLSSGLN